MKTKKLSYFWAVVAIAAILFLSIFPKQNQKPDFPPYPFSWFQCEHHSWELNLCTQLTEPTLADMQKWKAEEKLFSGVITPLRFFTVPVRNIAEQEQLSWSFPPDDKLEVAFYDKKALRLKEKFSWKPQYWFGKKNKFWFHNFFHQGRDEQDTPNLYKNFQVFQTGFYVGGMGNFFDPENEAVYQMQAVNEQSDLIPYAFNGAWILLKNQKPYQYFSFSGELFFPLWAESDELYFVKTNLESKKYELYYGKKFLTGFSPRPSRKDDPPYYYFKKQSNGNLALYTHFEKHFSYSGEEISDFQPYIDNISPLIHEQKKLIEDYISALDSKNYLEAYAMLYQPRLSLQAFIDQQEALKLTMRVLHWKIRTEVPLLGLHKGKIWPVDPENENHYHIRVYQLQNSGGVALVDYDIQLIDGKLKLQEGRKQFPEAGLVSADFNKKARLAYNYAYFLKTGRVQEAYKLLNNPKSDFYSFLKKHQGWKNLYVSEYLPEQLKINENGEWEQTDGDIFSDYFSLILSYEEEGKNFFRWYSGKQVGEQIKILEERVVNFSCTWLCNFF